MTTAQDAQRLPRQQVLIVSHPDGHIEIFGERNIDVCVCRVPVALSRDAECIADEVVDLRLPERYRRLRRADYLRKVGSTRPLRPSSMLDAAIVTDLIRRFDNELPEQLAAEANRAKVARERRAG